MTNSPIKTQKPCANYAHNLQKDEFALSLMMKFNRDFPKNYPRKQLPFVGLMHLLELILSGRYR